MSLVTSSATIWGGLRAWMAFAGFQMFLSGPVVTGLFGHLTSDPD